MVTAEVFGSEAVQMPLSMVLILKLPMINLNSLERVGSKYEKDRIKS